MWVGQECDYSVGGAGVRLQCGWGRSVTTVQVHGDGSDCGVVYVMWDRSI